MNLQNRDWPAELSASSWPNKGEFLKRHGYLLFVLIQPFNIKEKKVFLEQWCHIFI